MKTKLQITKLTPEQKAQMGPWADKWIEIGLRTGETDWDGFERGAKGCYAAAKIPWPGVVVRVQSPFALAIAAGGAVVALKHADAGRKADVDAVYGMTDDLAAGRPLPDTAIGKELKKAVMEEWPQCFGGQFWVGGWWWSGAWASFFREVCHVELPNNLWDGAKAYELTTQSACWWYGHRRFVMVCARPTVIHRELVNPARPRGWESHRLHCATGPAVAWPDGWGIWSWHGVRVSQQVIEAPQTMTTRQIMDEPNAEVRRIMIERFGPERFLRDLEAKPVHTDETGVLYRVELLNDEPLVMVRVRNATQEPDGTRKEFFLRVPPKTMRAREAVAWTFAMEESQYQPRIES